MISLKFLADPSIFFFLGGGGGGVSLILSRVNRKVGWIREIHEKKHLTTCKQNLACLKRDLS